MRRLRNFIGATLILGSTSALAWGPVGEEAFYKLDRSRARTSSIIKSGSINVKVTDQIADESGESAYLVHYRYDLNVSFVGRQKSQGNIKASVKYFEPSFIDELKEQGELNTAEFKIKYLGRETVTTNSGETYTDCDVILLSDIKLQQTGEVSDLAKSFLAPLVKTAQATASKGSQIMATQFENVKIKAAVKIGDVPVIGAVRVDVSATRQGFPISAGFDYAGNTDLTNGNQ